MNYDFVGEGGCGMRRSSGFGWLMAGALFAVPPAWGEQINLPGFPAYPTSQEQCSAPGRQWQQISSNINRQHSACLQSQACKQSNRNHRGECTCGACENLHALMTRFSSGDLAQYRRAQEKLCRQKVLAHEREEANRRAAYEDSRRRAAAAQAEAQRRWLEQERDNQRRQQEAMQEQRRQQELQRQQAMAMQQRMEQEQAERAAAAERALAALNNALADKPLAPSASAPVPSASPRIQPAYSPPPPREAPAIPSGAAMRDLEAINNDLASVAPAPARPSPASRLGEAFERAKASYDELMNRTFQIGDVKMRVQELKDTLTSMSLTYLSDLNVRSLTTAVGRGVGQVHTNPVLEMAGPFLDPENARNIDAAVRGARRQAQTGTMNENASRQMRDAMDELERQAGRDPVAERAARCQRLITSANRCRQESMSGDPGGAFSQCYNHYTRAWQASCR